MMRFGPTELEAPRLAAKKEKRATKSAKIQILLFSETEAAKQNQKFPFHFLSAPPTPSMRESTGIFLGRMQSRERTRRAGFASPRDRSVQCSTEPPRAQGVRSQSGSCSK